MTRKLSLLFICLFFVSCVTQRNKIEGYTGKIGNNLTVFISMSENQDKSIFKKKFNNQLETNFKNLNINANIVFINKKDEYNISDIEKLYKNNGIVLLIEEKSNTIINSSGYYINFVSTLFDMKEKNSIWKSSTYIGYTINKEKSINKAANKYSKRLVKILQKDNLI